MLRRLFLFAALLSLSVTNVAEAGSRYLTRSVQGGGQISLIGDGLKLYNPKGISCFRTAYANAATTALTVDVRGDSIAAGVGIENTGNVINNDVSDAFGWPGQLRSRFATALGTLEGGWITPQFPGSADARVTTVGTTNITSTGPMSSGVQMTSVSNAGAPGTITFTVPASTKLDLLVYQSTSGSPTTGAFSYQIDGGAVVPVANTNGGYVIVPMGSGLAATTHTVVVAGTSSTAASYIFAVRYGATGGVVVGRFARPGWTILDAFALGTNANLFGNAGGLARVADAWGAWSPRLTVITFAHNDAGTQTTVQPSGLYSDPTTYKAYLQRAIDSNTAKGGCTLLYAPQLPPVQTIPAGGADWLVYHDVMRDLAYANSNSVAFLDAKDVAGSVAQSLAADFYSGPSTVHPSRGGYARMADQVFRALTTVPLQ